MERKLVTAVLMVLVAGGVGLAEVPQLLNYQGKLHNGSGTAADGTVALGFGFYDAATGDTRLRFRCVTGSSARSSATARLRTASSRASMQTAPCFCKSPSTHTVARRR